MLDRITLIFTSQTASFAASDVHSLEELLLAIHALELNESVASIETCGDGFSVFDDQSLRLLSNFLLLFFDLPNR